MRDYDLVPGYPAEPTRVYPATERIFPKPMYMAERLKANERARRWRHGPNRQRYLASQRRQNVLSGLVKE